MKHKFFRDWEKNDSVTYGKNMEWSNICVTGVPKGGRHTQKKMFEEIMAYDFPNFVKIIH